MQTFYTEQIKIYENTTKFCKNSFGIQQNNSLIKTNFAENIGVPFNNQNNGGDKTPINMNSQLCNIIDISKDQKASKIIKRRRRNIMPSINPLLQNLMTEITENTNFCIESWKKRSTYSSIKTDRASKYVGVSRNGSNWQVLINMHYTKKYVGTYPTEKQAAIVYDFYSIAQNGIRAKTNFTYKRELITDMIQYYMQNENEFCPESFESRVE